MTEKIKTEQYPWPIVGEFNVERCALLSIDFQVDYCASDGYFADLGLDTSHLSSILGPVAEVLKTARNKGVQVIHTREGFHPDLSDCPQTKVSRAIERGHPMGRNGRYGRLLIQGEPGWDIVEAVYPHSDDWVIDKPGQGAFYATDLDLRLRSRKIDLLVIMGITAGCCVSSTIREANDRGYDCLVLTDCVADVFEELTDATIESFRVNPLGATAERDQFINALS
tara:strand:+ start:195 stop:869 length:675 start_codon:yes stop_codon:yes gene_type:complete